LVESNVGLFVVTLVSRGLNGGPGCRGVAFVDDIIRRRTLVVYIYAHCKRPDEVRRRKEEKNTK
jgi:hypothetical protein